MHAYWKETLEMDASKDSKYKEISHEVCCNIRDEWDDCTGCNPNLLKKNGVDQLECHKQGVLEVDYIYNDDDDTIDYLAIESRDCFCDRLCRIREDCCDDIKETCPHFFTKATV